MLGGWGRRDPHLQICHMNIAPLCLFSSKICVAIMCLGTRCLNNGTAIYTMLWQTIPIKVSYFPLFIFVLLLLVFSVICGKHVDRVVEFIIHLSEERRMEQNNFSSSCCLKKEEKNKERRMKSSRKESQVWGCVIFNSQPLSGEYSVLCVFIIYSGTITQPRVTVSRWMIWTFLYFPSTWKWAGDIFWVFWIFQFFCLLTFSSSNMYLLWKKDGRV